MKLQTPVNVTPLEIGLGYKDSMMFLGSCFADTIGSRCHSLWMVVKVNPFGVLFNPCSIAESLRLLEGNCLLSEEDVVKSPVGYCSLYHHSSFARESSSAFLRDANAELLKSREFYAGAKWIVVTLGTAFVYRHKGRGKSVANCLKLPAADFEKYMLNPRQVYDSLVPFVKKDTSRQWIFTVSPVRHAADGMHANQLSKSTLLLGVEEILADCSNAHYFPAYEIVLDELRDYRFYAEDMLHVSSQAAGHIFERFIEYALKSEDMVLLERARKLLSQMEHRPIIPGSELAAEFISSREEALSTFLKGLGRKDS